MSAPVTIHRREPLKPILTAHLFPMGDCDQVAAEAIIPQEIAWRIFTKGIDRNAALSQVKISGDSSLAMPVLGMISIVSA
jgi:hypothetical protein